MSNSQEFLSQKSVMRETKEKFDSFLKAALKEPPQTSLNEEISKTGTSTSSFQVDNFRNQSEEENKEFILNKFFENNSTVRRVDEVKPIPKPRTKFKSKNTKNLNSSPLSSNETFKVATKMDTLDRDDIVKSNTSSASTSNTYKVNAPKVVIAENTDIISNDSPASSTNTYKVSSPKILNTQNDEVSSQRSVKISNNEVPKIGDIIIHEKESTSKIVQVQVKNEMVYKKDSSIERKSDSTDSIKKKKMKGNSNNELKSDIKKIEGEEIATEAMNITIHRTDKLLLNSLVIHPVVNIHIVDIHTGSYYPKKVKERSVVYYYEDNLEYIAPIMTSPYSLQEKRSLIPSWEETILINEDYDYLVEHKNNLIIFFELLDFVSVPLFKNKTKGWHRIAFAFLKISGKNNALNLNKKMRLQLYKCSSEKKDTKACSLWESWRKGNLAKYPSSLYISITSGLVKGKLSSALRSSGPLEKEIGRHSEIANEESITKNYTDNDIISSLKNTYDENQEWRRHSEEITKLPNECLAKFETEKEGCFTLRFSHSGSLLACSLKMNNVYCVVIFSMNTFEQVCCLPGHQDIIYSIRWSPDDSLIIACSADCSVSIWDVHEVSFLQILPHPSFVYANEISKYLIITGCYDTKLRIWTEELASKFILNQELEGHRGYITSLLFNKSCDTILSSDSVGVIIEWFLQKNTWILHKKINILGLEGIAINQLEFIAREKRLLVHSRDNILRIMDLESSIVIHWLQGGLNTRYHTSCSVSPCGNYVVAGSENSSVNIWKVKTGKYVGSLIPYKNKAITIHALQFHPKDNMIAVGHFGDDLPVLIFGYNGKNTGSNIDLRLIGEKRNPSHDRRYPRNSYLKPNENKLDFTDVLHKIDDMMIGKPY